MKDDIKDSITHIQARPFITVKELYEEMSDRIDLKVVNSKVGFNRLITEKELHRPGLAFTGFIEVFTYWRVQIIGNTEIGYLNTLSDDERKQAVRTVFGFDLPCVILTGGNEPPQEMIAMANEKGITLFSTRFKSTSVAYHLSEFLDGVFAPTATVHGSLIDVYGVGMLITGPAAIGKSELALDLIERGHQLVADDVVHITKKGTNRLVGMPNEVLTHHMEIRGLGIIDIRRMFGIRAIRGSKDIEVVLRLEKWEHDREYERIGVDDKTIEILDVKVPLVELPLLVGKNITVIAEVTALNQKLKEHGEHAAREFNKNLIASMKKKSLEDEE